MEPSQKCPSHRVPVGAVIFGAWDFYWSDGERIKLYMGIGWETF